VDRKSGGLQKSTMVDVKKVVGLSNMPKMECVGCGVEGREWSLARNTLVVIRVRPTPDKVFGAMDE